MALLKEDGSLDIERMNSLSFEEWMDEMGDLTQEQIEEYLSKLPINESNKPMRAMVVDYPMEEDGVDIEDYFNSCLSKSNLKKVLDKAVSKALSNNNEPDKIVSVLYNTYEPSSDGEDLYDFISETRFYIKEKKVVFITPKKIHIIPFSKIVSYDIVLPNEDSKPVHSSKIQGTKTDTGNMVKRAIIGGILGGGVGAVIGGATAKTKTTTEENMYAAVLNQPLYELRIKFDDIINPVIIINFDTNKQMVQEVANSLDVIVRQNADNNNIADEERISIPFNIKNIADTLNITPQNPYAKYNEDNDNGYVWNDPNTWIGLIFVIAIVFGLLYMCS